MDKPFPSALHPSLLPPGTVVGAWRVEAWASRGVYGAVYRARPVDDEQASSVALKIALHPADPRFAREVQLLARSDHPNIPRLLDHGSWQSPSGTLHPFIVMQWVDGVPFYEWARQHPPSHAQVLRWLAQLASALADLHARGAVHRDLKGDNVLVRRSDGLAVLTDFGSGLYPGAAPLTPPMGFPGTPAYRSPESWLFELQFFRDSSARYSATPADDLYSLGVLACRLLTGAYPELAEPTQDEHGTWHLEAVLPPAPLLSGPHVQPLLREWVLRLLSVHPGQRGTAEELALELAQAAGHPAQELSPSSVAGPALAPESPPPAEPTATAAPIPQVSAAPYETRAPLATESAEANISAQPPRLRAPEWRAKPWLALAAAALALAVWARLDTPGRASGQNSLACADGSGEGSEDAGTRGLGEVTAATSMEQRPSASLQEKVAGEPLPEPLPGQTRPDAKGRCPLKRQVALNGGCWAETSWDREECVELGGQMFKGTCYVPSIPPGRRPTSSPKSKP
jgi:serine/threonine protein kinase